MRRTTLIPLALCAFGLACTSTTNLGEEDSTFLGYSLTLVDGEALPGPLSSLPGLVIWEGEDGTQLALWRGRAVCNEDGSAEESYGFRLAAPGSDIWDLIVVELDLTCEAAGPGQVAFQNSDTGEVLYGALQEGFEACPALAKALPSVESLRAGYVSSQSEVQFPAELAFSATLNGEFRLHTCSGMWD